MTRKSGNTVRATPEALAAARAKITPEFLAWFDSLTDEDIARQIAETPDSIPELDDGFFERARVVRPLKAAE